MQVIFPTDKAIELIQKEAQKMFKKAEVEIVSDLGQIVIEVKKPCKESEVFPVLRQLISDLGGNNRGRASKDTLIKRARAAGATSEQIEKALAGKPVKVAQEIFSDEKDPF